MATRIHKGTKRRYFLKEHRKALKALDPKWTAAYLAELLDLHEKSVHRIEREPWRLNDEEADQWARALGFAGREALWRPPGQPALESVDRILENAEPAIHEAVAALAKRLVARRH